MGKKSACPPTWLGFCATSVARPTLGWCPPLPFSNTNLAFRLERSPPCLKSNPFPPVDGGICSQRLMEERDALREANEELRCAQVQQKFLNQAGEPQAVCQNLSWRSLLLENGAHLPVESPTLQWLSLRTFVFLKTWPASTL